MNPIKKVKKEITYANTANLPPSSNHGVSISRVYRATDQNNEEELEENLVDFWNELASTYDLLVRDWNHFVQWNGEVIDQEISFRMNTKKKPEIHHNSVQLKPTNAFLAPNPKRLTNQQLYSQNNLQTDSKIIDSLNANNNNHIKPVEMPRAKKYDLLDCTCGIGTQSLGLVQIKNEDNEDKYVVTGSTVAPKEIERAMKEAETLGVSAKLKLKVTDMRKLRDIFPQNSFDVVISCGDAFPHLLHDNDIEEALVSIKTILRPGGLVLITIRDYDAILKEKRMEDERLKTIGRGPAATKITLPRMFDNGVNRRVVYQVWDWNVFDNEQIFRVNHYQTTETLIGNTNVSTKNSCVYYRMLTRDSLTQWLIKTGFKDVVWREPKRDTAFYQPVVTAFI